jgi:thiamine pyrophosphokinase
LASQQVQSFQLACTPLEQGDGYIRILRLARLLMKKYVILLGGDITPTPRLIEQCRDAIVIAADSGVRHAPALGLDVALWLGDFDSTTPALLRKFNHLPRKTFPREKDKTDGELAINTAIAQGASELILVGAFGGPRADHALLHLTQAISLAKRGLKITLSSGDEEAYPIASDRQIFDVPKNLMFSLIGFTDLTGVTITGARWPLTSCDVPFGSSMTLSNETAGTLEIEIKAGDAMLILSFITAVIVS